MLADLAFFQAEHPYAVAIYVFLVGAALGSFINVVAYRLPMILERYWTG